MRSIEAWISRLRPGSGRRRRSGRPSGRLGALLAGVACLVLMAGRLAASPLPVITWSHQPTGLFYGSNVIGTASPYTYNIRNLTDAANDMVRVGLYYVAEGSQTWYRIAEVNCASGASCDADITWNTTAVTPGVYWVVINVYDGVSLCTGNSNGVPGQDLGGGVQNYPDCGAKSRMRVTVLAGHAPTGGIASDSSPTGHLFYRGASGHKVVTLMGFADDRTEGKLSHLNVYTSPSGSQTWTQRGGTTPQAGYVPSLSGTFAWDTTGLVDGTYYAVVNAYGQGSPPLACSGNIPSATVVKDLWGGWVTNGGFYSCGATAYQTLTLATDTTPPANPTGPASESHNATSGNWNNLTVPGFAWSDAADGESGVAGYWVYWGTDPNADPALLGDYQAGNRYLPLTALVNGTTYYLRVKAQDVAGNVAPGAITLFTDRFDNVAPTAIVTTLLGTHYVTAPPLQITSGRDFVIEGDQVLDDNSGGSVGTALTWVMGMDANADPGTANPIAMRTQFTTTQTTNGLYYLRLRLRDGAGNWTAPFTAATNTYDTQPPDPVPGRAVESGGIQDSGNGTGTHWTNQRPALFTWPVAMDLPKDGYSTGVRSYETRWTRPGGIIYYGPDFWPNPRTEFEYSCVTDGIYRLTAAAWDGGANRSPETEIFAVAYDGHAPTATVGLTPSGWTNQTITATVTARDEYSGVARVSCKRSDEVNWTEGSTTCSRPLTANGTLQYYTVDNLGNGLGTSSTPQSYSVLNIDTTAPSSPTSVTAGPNLASGVWTTQTLSSLAWSGAADSESGVAGYWVSWGSDPNADPQTAGSLQSSSTFTVPAALSSNTYYLVLRTQDIAGNVSSPFLAFTYKYDNEPPVPAQITFPGLQGGQ